MNNTTNNLGIIPAEHLDTFRAGVELDLDPQGKVSGVRFNTFKDVKGRGITLNPVAVEVIKQTAIHTTEMKGQFSKFNANA